MFFSHSTSLNPRDSKTPPKKCHDPLRSLAGRGATRPFSVELWGGVVGDVVEILDPFNRGLTRVQRVEICGYVVICGYM
jgi:hypothetical protein